MRFIIRRAATWLVIGVVTMLGGCGDDAGASAPRDAAAVVAVDAAPIDAAAAEAPVTDAPANAGAETAPAACPAAPVESECDPVAAMAVPLPEGRIRRCAFDLGSTNVKLVMSSLVAGERDSIEGDRVCKKALRLRERTQDPMTMMGRPLLETDMDALVAQLKTYAELCSRDQGMLVGAVATQWARTATNQDQIKTWFKDKVGLDLAILTSDQEGAYAYAAGTHDRLDRILLDVGGGSFQLSFWPTGEPRPTVVGVPLGHDASSEKVWSKPELTTFPEARAAYLTELAALIAAKPATAAAYARLEALVAAGTLTPELISLGDSGVILAAEGKLQDPAGHFVDQQGYLDQLEQRRRDLAGSTVMGPKKTLTLPALEAFLDKLATTPAWFAELRSPCIRQAYGAKVLGVFTLVSHLIKQYRLGERLVFTSGEMAEGFILEKLR